MKSGAKNRPVLRISWCFFILFAVFIFLRADSGMSGNVIGFIYAQDGTTPLEGAVVKFKHLVSGSVFESTRSDANGIFRLRGIETGMYTYGVMTGDGGFNAANIVGIQVDQNQTAKMSITLRPYSAAEARAFAEILKDLETEGESLVGTIADYDVDTGMAQVQMIKGILRLRDRIHTRGRATDFYQDIDVLKVGSLNASQVMNGQTGIIRLEQKAEEGDLVLIVRDKKIFPLFLAPLGLAAVTAGNNAVIYGIIKIKDQGEPVSAFRNK
jgi:hypothetical protein